MADATYTITGIDADKGCVRVEMASNGFELHEDVHVDELANADEATVLAAVDAVAAKFASDVARKVPEGQAKPSLPIDKLIGQAREVAAAVDEVVDVPTAPEK